MLACAQSHKRHSHVNIQYYDAMRDSQCIEDLTAKRRCQRAPTDNELHKIDDRCRVLMWYAGVQLSLETCVDTISSEQFSDERSHPGTRPTSTVPWRRPGFVLVNLLHQQSDRPLCRARRGRLNYTYSDVTMFRIFHRRFKRFFNVLIRHQVNADEN